MRFMSSFCLIIIGLPNISYYIMFLIIQIQDFTKKVVFKTN